MQIAFSKYQGAGNDFILIDRRQVAVCVLSPQLIAHLCNRRTGIGADGVLTLETSCIADYKMRIFNADGSEPSMCGNGVRCVMAYLKEKEQIDQARIEIAGRILRCKCQNQNICVELGAPLNVRKAVELTVDSQKLVVHLVNTGVAHAVIFVQDVATTPVLNWGRAIRVHDAFAPEGVNVNFAQISDKGHLLVRTYERGVEGETLCCGSGAAAVAWMAQHLKLLGALIEVHTRTCMEEIAFGQSLYFSFHTAADRQEITMTGPALRVFSGQISIS